MREHQRWRAAHGGQSRRPMTAARACSSPPRSGAVAGHGGAHLGRLRRQPRAGRRRGRARSRAAGPCGCGGRRPRGRARGRLRPARPAGHAITAAGPPARRPGRAGSARPRRARRSSSRTTPAGTRARSAKLPRAMTDPATTGAAGLPARAAAAQDRARRGAERVVPGRGRGAGAGAGPDRDRVAGPGGHRPVRHRDHHRDDHRAAAPGGHRRGVRAAVRRPPGGGVQEGLLAGADHRRAVLTGLCAWRRSWRWSTASRSCCG